MNDTRLSLTFYLSQADSFDTLEAVLATARRGGLTMHAMHVINADAERMHTVLALKANCPELLDLFVARLHNLYCVEDVEVHSAQAVGVQRPTVCTCDVRA